MREPVLATDGHSYELRAIADVLERGNGLSPLTREPLRPLLVHNVTLRRRIESYEEEQAALLETVAHAQRERQAEPEDGPPARRQRVS